MFWEWSKNSTKKIQRKRRKKDHEGWGYFSGSIPAFLFLGLIIDSLIMDQTWQALGFFHRYQILLKLLLSFAKSATEPCNALLFHLYIFLWGSGSGPSLWLVIFTYLLFSRQCPQNQKVKGQKVRGWIPGHCCAIESSVVGLSQGALPPAGVGPASSMWLSL